MLERGLPAKQLARGCQTRRVIVLRGQASLQQESRLPNDLIKQLIFEQRKQP
jgi:hypothetical protein